MRSSILPIGRHTRIDGEIVGLHRVYGEKLQGSSQRRALLGLGAERCDSRCGEPGQGNFAPVRIIDGDGVLCTR